MNKQQSEHDKYVAERMDDPGHRNLTIIPLTLILTGMVVGVLGGILPALIMVLLGIILLAQAGSMVRSEAELAVNQYEGKISEEERKAGLVGLSCFSLFIGLLLISAAFIAIYVIVSGY